jgi:hypothetical protein
MVGLGRVLRSGGGQRDVRRPSGFVAGAHRHGCDQIKYGEVPLPSGHEGRRKGTPVWLADGE